MASTYVGSSQAAVESWKSKKPQQNLLEQAIGLVPSLVVPVTIAVVAFRRFRAHRKSAAAKKSAEKPAAAEAKAPEARKPRRDYKVKRDQEGPLLMGADDAEDGPEVQPHDNVMHGYSEDEVEAAGAAAAGPGAGNTQMLQMLQQMGYKVIMPKDGSGQVFLVPPGAAGPGGEGAIEEGDEEGYDEDEEGEEEDEDEDE
ncbi:hypothetical protein HYH03_012594 [Edaphochlamys debaryana]|uniref:Uncharacterized protein n=1 Tax=Edaphochlamys debaryana TaxID=47281 RepID=A0A835Y072_9CHLO|nr:hypothetical protein HYH03_012594 [Edaphochlamys debaryana]|eukprot:KAG2488794.1 hypothetical protein HYH03_012594 [Edaphochlamys debaryana]